MQHNDGVVDRAVGFTRRHDFFVLSKLRMHFSLAGSTSVAAQDDSAIAIWYRIAIPARSDSKAVHLAKQRNTSYCHLCECVINALVSDH
jgi:hypothetical protein